MAEIFPDLHKSRVVFASKGEEITYMALHERLLEIGLSFTAALFPRAKKARAAKKTRLILPFTIPNGGSLRLKLRVVGLGIPQKQANFFLSIALGKAFRSKILSSKRWSGRIALSV